MTVVMLQLRECLAKLQGSCQLMVELMAAVNVTHVYYTNLAHLIRNLVTKVTDTVSNASQICACCCTIEIACCSIQLPVVLECKVQREERDYGLTAPVMQRHCPLFVVQFSMNSFKKSELHLPIDCAFSMVLLLIMLADSSEQSFP